MSEICHVVKESIGIYFLLCDPSPNQLDFFMPAWSYEEITEHLISNYFMKLLHIAGGNAKWNPNGFTTLKNCRLLVKWPCNPKILLLDIDSSEMEIYLIEKKLNVCSR